MTIARVTFLTLLLTAVAALSIQAQGPAHLSKRERIRLCEKKAGVPLEEGPEPRKVEGGVVRPRPIHQVVSGAFKGVRATVVVEGVVDEDGCMRQVRTAESTDKGLEAAAMESVGQWVFEPATLNGAPVRVFYSVTINGYVR